jgi:transposase
VQLQYITEHLHLPEFKVVRCQQIEEENTWLLGVEPVKQVPPCPYCCNPNVIRNGVPYHRTVRHLDSFGQKTYLLVPAIRLFCKSCEANYMWRYESIPPKSRDTKDFQEHLSLTIKRSTVQHGKDCGSSPYSTTERFYKKWLTENEKKQREKNWGKAIHSKRLILGIDDFAIRKGHSYNTGIHDLRGESLLDIASGRTYKELCSYSKRNPTFLQLKPYAVVMDLAKSYHRFIKECFPEALCIADRFHVPRHVMECLQQIRKELQQSLPPRLAKQAKRARYVLFKRKETLCPSDIRQSNLFFLFPPY